MPVVNTKLGPYGIGDTLPAWVLTIEDLATPATWVSVVLDLETPADTDLDIGTTTMVLSVVGDDLMVTFTPDTSVKFLIPGWYKGTLTLVNGLTRQSVQQFAFFVRNN